MIVSRVSCRPHSFVVRRSVNNASRRPTRCGGDDTDDGYNDDDGCDDRDDDYFNCSLLLQNKPKMRSCRRWSQADSLALDSPPLLTANAFRIGGAVSTSGRSGDRPRFGGPSSLQQAYTPPPPQKQLPSLQQQLPSLQQQLPPRSSPPPLPPPLVHKPPPPLPPPPPPLEKTVVDLPAIPESSQWDEQRGRHRRRTPEQQQSDRLERNGSTRVSGRNPYRTLFNGRAASPAGATAPGPGGGENGVVPAGHCHRDNLQVRFFLRNVSLKTPYILCNNIHIIRLSYIYLKIRCYIIVTGIRLV